MPACMLSFCTLRMLSFCTWHAYDGCRSLSTLCASRAYFLRCVLNPLLLTARWQTRSFSWSRICFVEPCVLAERIAMSGTVENGAALGAEARHSPDHIGEHVRCVLRPPQPFSFASLPLSLRPSLPPSLLYPLCPLPLPHELGRSRRLCALTKLAPSGVQTGGGGHPGQTQVHFIRLQERVSAHACVCMSTSMDTA
jgi:hypothetical protein